MAQNTKISIVSSAYIMLGEGAIASFTQGGVPATVAANLYDTIYETALTDHRWLFASKKEQLAKITGTPTGGYWDYGFQMPTDMVRLVTPKNKDGSSMDFEINGDVLLTNESEVFLEYVYKPEEQFLPPYFVKYLEYAVARDCAIAITQSADKSAFYNRLAENQLRRARSIDNQSSPQGGWGFDAFTRGGNDYQF